MSRDPQDTEKIQAPSIPELKDQLQSIAKRFGRKVSFRGRKMGYGPLLNAIVIHYISLTTDQQLEIAKLGIARFEKLLESDEEVADPRLVDAVLGTGRLDTDVLLGHAVTERPKSDRKRKPAQAKD